MPSAGGTKPEPSLNDFTSTFVLSSTSNTLVEIPKELAIEPLRERRAHRKSRVGCENCKRLRVKCSEEIPCARCSQRGEQCQRSVRYNEVISVPKISDPAPISGVDAMEAQVNLLHMELFHHFQTSTRQTLLFVPELWESTLRLCFQFDFLMNAMLCVAARHLAILRPDIAIYSAAATNHLIRASSRFRLELSKNLISAHIDAFIATSMLLQYEIWASTDFVSTQDDGVLSFDPSKDRIFVFASSLKEVFLKSISQESAKNSVFMREHIRIDPTDKLVEVAQISSVTLEQYQAFFSYDRPPSSEQLSIPISYRRGTYLPTPSVWQQRLPKAHPDPVEDGYKPVVRRLCLIMSFLPESQPPQAVSSESSFFPELARYILSFPVMCHGPFTAMVKRSDPHALLLLYHFYRAAKILLPTDRCWWAHERASVSEIVLKHWLLNSSLKQFC